MKNAVVLLSGGIDSTTTLAIAKTQGFQINALSFRYGQRHVHELIAAERIVKNMHVEKHLILNIPLDIIGGSALTDRMDVPKNRSKQEMDHSIPVTYVPARNTIFLSFALAWAEMIPAYDIFIGVNIMDYSGYPDCRPEYIEAYQQMANLATKASAEGQKINIQTPLIAMTKAQIIKKGKVLGVDYSLTHSCYDPDKNGLACGRCDSCLLRKKGFQEADMVDPVKYQ